MSMKFKFNGRSVPSGQLGKVVGDAVRQSAFEQVRDNVRARLSYIRCPEHHQSPQVTSSGTSLSNLKWNITGCCDRVVEEARRALK